MGLSGSTGTRETPILSESSYLGFRDFTKNCAIADPNWAAGVQQSVIVRQMPAMRSVFWGGSTVYRRHAFCGVLRRIGLEVRANPHVRSQHEPFPVLRSNPHRRAIQSILRCISFSQTRTSDLPPLKLFEDRI